MPSTAPIAYFIACFIILGAGIEFEAGKAFTDQQRARAYGCGVLYALVDESKMRHPDIAQPPETAECRADRKLWEASP